MNFSLQSITNRARDRVRMLRASDSSLARFAGRGLSASYAWVRHRMAIAVDPEYRSVVLTKLLNPKTLHQALGTTAHDRYPAIFSACRDFFRGVPAPRILSFGCSTGEEVLTLRRYFPDATLTGAEVNRRSLAQCRRMNTDQGVSFVYSTPAALRKMAPFDAIFCMAVLQRLPLKRVGGEFPADIKDIYPFERFDEQITEFDGLLRVGGLLVVHAKAYSFYQSSVAQKYVPLSTIVYSKSDGVKYDRHSRRTDDFAGLGSTFVKVA